MRTDDIDTVTDWIRGLGTSRHEDASKLLWDRYFARLARLAHGRLRGASRAPADGEDVALSVFDSFFRGAAAGRFDRLDGRDDFWRLLVTIASRKASNAARDELRHKRGGLAEFDNAARDELRHKRGGLAEFDDARALAEVAGADPSPEFAALVADESRRLFEALSDDSLRQVVRLRLEGYSNEEIAATLNCGLRTVERKLALIRKRWLAEGDS